MIDLFQSVADFFGADRYQPLSASWSGDPSLIFPYVALRLSIWASDWVIGFLLIVNRHMWADMSPTARMTYGAVFILSGSSRLTSALTVLTGVYLLDIFILALTAGVSVATAIYTTRAFLGSWRLGK